ncbi:Alpha-mannosidase 2C1 [Chytriomyces hyalinus]|nr:Alpha-mannosidase 2C1 [Chytriomyces hyalinus]
MSKRTPPTTNLNTLQKHRGITQARFERFMQRGQFDDVNLQTAQWVKRTNEAVTLSVFAPPELKRIPFEEAVKGEYKPAKIGDWFGPTNATFWFKADIEIPASWAGLEVQFEFDADNEVMIWSTDGKCLVGLTGGSGGDRHADYPLTKNAVAGEKFHFYLEMACNFRGGMANGGGMDLNRTWRLNVADIAVRNKIGFELYGMFDLMNQLTRETSEEWQINADAMYHADLIVNTFRINDEDALNECHRIAKQFFADRKRTGKSLHTITAVGNCHIDTAWLWPFSETKRKAGRSWARQIHFMKSHPTFTFAASQAQQFEWVEEWYPTLFKDMQEYTKKGQFIPIGGTWVEMDTNMPSGEALCRQFIYGQRYFGSRFGKRCTVFWLPDTFGYSAQLPQISNLAGMPYFFTQKISWNNINRFPHTTFKWAGLDNSEILTHFAPADTYVGQCNVGDFVRSVHNNKDKVYSNKSIFLYGNGDGGGGPLLEMLTKLETLKDLEGLPGKVEDGDPSKFYEDLEATSHGLVRWKGELYFELHRGTYTSHGLIKKYNRQSENLMREIEFLSTLALANPHKSKTSKANAFVYPKAEIDRLWKLVLLCQFHDVLPGSSIKMVYDDALVHYKDVEASGKKLKDEALKAFMAGIESGNNHAQAVTVINTTSWPVDAAVVEVNPSDLTAGAELYGTATWQQFSRDGKALVYVNNVSTGSVRSFALGNKPADFVPVTVKPVSIRHGQVVNADGFLDVATKKAFVVENNFIKATIDENGRLVSLIHRETNRESIAKDQLGNVFKIFEDIPTAWDAWDVEVYHLEKGWDGAVGTATVLEAGPLRVVIGVKHPLTPLSTIEQKIILTAADAKVEFETKVDWHENRVILKVEFPLNVNCDVATYETQFGYIQRPTHYNTSWDLARFEVCGHKFADLSEYGFGVSLLNDCKYGYSTLGNVMRMSLLRAPKDPDNTTDMEVHSFNYAIYPHKGAFLESDVVKVAYQYNIKPITHPTLVNPSALASADYFTVSEPNFVLDTVKVAEDARVSGQNGQVDVILRFYEAYGGRGVANVKTLFNIKEAKLCNLLEDFGDAVKIEEDGSLNIAFTPFKIVTVRCLIETLDVCRHTSAYSKLYTCPALQPATRSMQLSNILLAVIAASSSSVLAADGYGYSDPKPTPAPVAYGYGAPAPVADPGYGYSAPKPTPAPVAYGYGAPAPAATPYGYSDPKSTPAPVAYGYGAPAPVADPGYGYSAPKPTPAPVAYGYGAPAPAATPYGYSDPKSTPAPVAYGYGAPAPVADPGYGYSAPKPTPVGYGYGAPAPAATPYGYSAPKPTPVGYGAPAPVADPGYGYSAPKPTPVGYGYGAPAPAATPYGYSAPKPTPVGYGAPAPVADPGYGYSAPKPTPVGYGYGAPAPAATPYGYSAPKPTPVGYGYGAPAPVADPGYGAAKPTPVGYGYNAPAAPGYSKPDPVTPGYGKPEPVGYGKPDPVTPGYSKPDPVVPGYGKPEPVGYGKPEPVGYGKPDPVMPGYSKPDPVVPGYGKPEPVKQGYGGYKINGHLFPPGTGYGNPNGEDGDYGHDDDKKGGYGGYGDSEDNKEWDGNYNADFYKYGSKDVPPQDGGDCVPGVDPTTCDEKFRGVAQCGENGKYTVRQCDFMHSCMILDEAPYAECAYGAPVNNDYYDEETSTEVESSAETIYE